MSGTPQRRTVYARGPLAAALACALLGVGLFGLHLSQRGLLAAGIPALLLGGIGWGTPRLLAALLAGMLSGGGAGGADGALGLAMAAWAAAAGLLAFGVRTDGPLGPAPSAAAGARLHPRLGRYRDFHWSTLGAYGGGILGAELALVLLQTWCAGAVSLTGATVEDGGPLALSPIGAFAVSGTAAVGVAFVAGFLGAVRSKRLSIPELTVGLIYFGLPVPVALTLVSLVPDLGVMFGYRLREVMYLASLIGRPEASFWLAYAGLVLVMVLGITAGFVVTGSGRVELRAGTELFIAGRHVNVFRWRLLVGVLAVLLFGIIPPLLLYAILRAAEDAVERTRIRKLGEADPLAASEALHAWKLREQSPTAMMTSLSVGGVGVGVMALVIVLSVMSGFEQDLQKKILGTNAHAVVMKYSEDFGEYADTARKVASVAGVTGVTPFILNEVMISSEGNIAGTIIKGIDPATIGAVSDLPENIQPGGKLEWLVNPSAAAATRLSPKGGAALDERPAGDGAAKDPLEGDPIVQLQRAPGTEKPVVLPGILVGRELASSLKVVVGDRVNVVSPLGGELGPQGPMPKSRPFRVVGIFYSGMYEYDSKMVYIRLEDAQSFFNVKGVTGLELKVADIDDARNISKAVLGALEGYPYRTKDWGEMNKNLFSALRLEKLVMGLILSIIVVVAAGLIVATVIMLVLEKRKEIAVLKALGVPDGGIVKIFLAEGLQIGVAGSLLGLVSGLAWCLFIDRVKISLDPEVYYIPALPVKIEPLQTAIPVIIAVLVTFLASVYPALKASRVEPVEGLKSE
jgi:lipoprotein-releasing system permease protein